MSVAVIVQARMGSTRLPGKVMKEVLGKPLLQIQLERLQQLTHQVKLIVATTDSRADQCITALCQEMGVQSVCGDCDDLIKRYLIAAEAVDAETIVRITGDCPLIDPAVVDQVIQAFLDEECDLATNVHPRTFPRGMDCEVLSKRTLERLNQLTEDSKEREHLTLYLYQNPGLFLIQNVEAKEDSHHLRLTVDTAEDFSLIKQILEALYPSNPHFTLEETLVLLKKYPKWQSINQKVQQKDPYE